jgi:uncharacterized protein involved in exopolysaccharide biosynthesis
MAIRRRASSPAGRIVAHECFEEESLMGAAQDEAVSDASLKGRSESGDRVISLIDVFTVLWSSKWVILAATIVVAAGAAVTSRFLDKQYEASTVVSVVSDEGSSSGLGALGAIASQFTGLASFATSNNNRKAEYIAILQSETLTTAFIERNNLLPVLYAREWDGSANRWKKTKDAPTLWMANRLFKASIRKTTIDLRTTMVTLSITWHDAAMSAQWANGIVALANEYIRAKAISDGERNIAYLNEQLAQSNVVAVQNSISALLENEIKKIMLARGSEEYAFKIIDAATMPERPSSPNPLVWAIVGSTVGILVSSLLVLAFSRRLRRRVV